MPKTHMHHSILGEALRVVREGTVGADGEPLTRRELARRAGVSHTQISRIESGEILKPAPELLQSLARALECNPRPLLILAGHIGGDDARAELKPMFRDGAELVEAWEGWPQFTVEEARTLLTDPDADEDDIKRLAADVFATRESGETLWQPEDETIVRGEGQAGLRTLINAWRNLGDARRTQLIDYAHALTRLEDLELRLDVDEVRIDAATITSEPAEPAPFDEEFLRLQGFEGFVRILALPPSATGIPATPGVYVVLRRSSRRPDFLAESPGGRFKGKDPSVALDRLQENWIDGARTVYLGRASDLRQRLDLLARFGRGEPVGHWGGRLLWQLADHEQLLVAWLETTNQVQTEAELIDEFMQAYGALPFANLNQPRGVDA